MNFKKMVTTALSLTMLTGVLAGCTPKSPATPVPTQAPAETPAQTPTEEPKPQDGGKVVVYSPHSEEMLTKISELFKAETGITVEFLQGAGGDMVSRIIAEKENPQCDVLYGSPTSVFLDLKKSDLIQPFAPSWDTSLDDSFKDPDGYYYATMRTDVVIVYNKDLVKPEDVPTDWSDLIDPKYKGKLLFRSSTSASSKATFSSLLYMNSVNGDEEKGWEFMKQLDQNVSSYVDNSSLVFQALGRGDATISFWTVPDIHINVVDNNLPLGIVSPKSGAVVISDCIAVIKNAKNKKNAEKYAEFVGRTDIQALLANDFSRTPVDPKALEQSPDWMKELNITPLPVDWDVLSENMGPWMQKWEDTIKNSSK